MHIRTTVSAAILIGMLGASGAASAGDDARIFRPAVKADGHAFYGVQVGNHGCVLGVKLYYNAPKDAYDAKTIYRFRAKVTFFGGGSVYTRTFTNKRPGNKRVFYYPRNTRHAGCWARNDVRIRNLFVVSCEGRKCKLPKLR